jgi:hypothetical protein
VVEPKPSSRPSFKNLLDIEREKLPSRSKSKSLRSVSNPKVSSIPHKSPKKPILRPRDDTNNTSNTSLRKVSERSTGTERRHETEVPSEMGRSSKSLKKAKGMQETMKKIILLKNKVVEMDQLLHQQETQLSKLQKRTTSEPVAGAHCSEEPRLRSMAEYLDSFLADSKTRSEEMERKYCRELDAMMEGGGYEQCLNTMQPHEPNTVEKEQVGMAHLSKKLDSL